MWQDSFGWKQKAAPVSRPCPTVGRSTRVFIEAKQDKGRCPEFLFRIRAESCGAHRRGSGASGPIQGAQLVPGCAAVSLLEAALGVLRRQAPPLPDLHGCRGGSHGMNERGEPLQAGTGPVLWPAWGPIVPAHRGTPCTAVTSVPVLTYPQHPLPPKSSTRGWAAPRKGTGAVSALGGACCGPLSCVELRLPRETS